ncbi:MAG: DUF2877 domain-containing protein [Acidobacteria bacterium]|nr:DUF2877 domain-containing protein [Acidobacteriota bacterium]
MRVSSCKVRSIGEAAFDWLSSGRGGKVLATVTHAVYLLGGQDELLWMAPETSPMHRRCMRVSSPLPRMEAGAGFQVRDGLLVTGTGEALDFGCSPVWKPPVLSKSETITVSGLGGLVRSAYRQLTAQKQPSGWGVLIPAILQVAESQYEPEVAGNGIILPGTVWPAVKGIVLACLAHDFGFALEHGAGLVGLGAGLTPSGDDFLGGLSFSIGILRCAYPEIKDLQTWNYPNYLLRSQSQTNMISFTLLKDHAEGHALEPLHRFANALLTGQPVDQFLPFAGELVAVGHSTGWDLLTGFLAGMSVTFSS